MAGYRFNLDLFIPEAVYNAIPVAKRTAFKDAVLAVKAYAVKINEGLPEEEMTIRAVYHICHHDEGVNHPICEPEQEI